MYIILHFISATVAAGAVISFDNKRDLLTRDIYFVNSFKQHLGSKNVQTHYRMFYMDG